jgi:ArsR family transcriptional regulator
MTPDIDAIHKDLAALQRAGLITSKRVGQWVFFKRNEPVIQAFLEHMNAKL